MKATESMPHFVIYSVFLLTATTLLKWLCLWFAYRTFAVPLGFPELSYWHIAGLSVLLALVRKQSMQEWLDYRRCSEAESLEWTSSKAVAYVFLLFIAFLLSFGI